jgi:O-antigen ligase
VNDLILLVTVALAFWLVRRDGAARPGVSRAIWIPTWWVGILASRPLSAWLGFSGGDTLEGSPVDRLFFFGLIFAALVVLSRRRVSWARFFSQNWPIFLFYGYLLVTVLWANSPLVSGKRWIKEFGNIFVALVVLTEADPIQAIRAVFVRCAYVLIPLSIVFIRYFPDLGRRYSIHSGGLEVTGVTTQKNALGAMILVCALMFLWDWLERSRPGAAPRSRLDRYAAIALLAAAAWLLYLSDSKTSITCLGIAGGIIAAVRLPFLHRRISGMGTHVLIACLGFFLLDQMFGVSAAVVSDLGRDMTFTGRTDVWRELLQVHTDPVFGTGFMSFWDDAQYRSRLPEWVAFSAHNGYLEIYLAGGAIGVGLLAVLILAAGLRINRALAGSDHYAVVRFAIFVAMLLANFSESNFACMTPLGFLFLIAAIGQVETVRVPHARAFAGPRRGFDQATPVNAPLLS